MLNPLVNKENLVNESTQNEETNKPMKPEENKHNSNDTYWDCSWCIFCNFDCCFGCLFI